MKTVVIYHRADFDGLFCREIAKKFLGSEGVEYIGWDYGDTKLVFPPEGTVYVLDLSPECFEEAEFLKHVEGYAPLMRIIWIDHHKSAIEKFSPAILGYRIDGVAACRLTWQWFAGLAEQNKVTKAFEYTGAMLPAKQDFVDRTVEEPLAVRLAGEYDIWDKRDPRAELFQHGLRGAERDFQWLLSMDPSHQADKYVGEILDQGRAIQYVATEQNASIIRAYGFTMVWEGLTFLCCNHARFNSHLFTAGLTPEHEALLGFNYDGSKDEWRVSLYHAPGHEQHDLSAIAKKYGGGGHRGACGFRSQECPALWRRLP